MDEKTTNRKFLGQKLKRNRANYSKPLGQIPVVKGYNSRLKVIAQEVMPNQAKRTCLKSKYYDEAIMPTVVEKTSITRPLWSSPLSYGNFDNSYEVESFSEDGLLHPYPQPPNHQIIPEVESDSMDNSTITESDKEPLVPTKIPNQETLPKEVEEDLHPEEVDGDLQEVSRMRQSNLKSRLPNTYTEEIDEFNKQLQEIVEKSPKSSSPPTSSEDSNQETNTNNQPQQLGHDIFDRIGESRKYANTFNVGKIDVGKRFDAFDLDLDKTEASTQQKIAEDLGLDSFDIMADLAQISEERGNAGESNTLSAQNGEANKTTRVGKQRRNIQKEAILSDIENLRSAQSTGIKHDVPIIRKSDSVSDLAASAAMVLAWKQKWQTTELESGQGPWQPYLHLLDQTESTTLGEWQLEILESYPEERSEWITMLNERGPLLITNDTESWVLTGIDSQVYINQPDQGEVILSYDQFDEKILRVHATGTVKIAVYKQK